MNNLEKLPQRNQLKVKLGLCSFVLILMFVLLELGIRLLFPQKTYENFKSIDAPVFMASELIPWTLKPNSEGLQISPYGEFNVTVKVNSIGTRGPEPIKKGKNVKRILFLGDSFTFGFGVSANDAYPTQVGYELKRKFTDHLFDIVNAGYANGYSPDTYYIYLKNNLNLLDPDLVIMGLYTRNDIIDLSSTNWNKINDDGLPGKITSTHYYVDSEGRRRKTKAGLFKNELIYKLHLTLYSYSHLYVFTANTINNTIFAKSKIPIFSNDWDNELQANWEKVKKVISATKTILKEKNIPIILVLINSRIQTVDSFWKLYQKKYGSYSLNRVQPNEKILNFCEQEKLHCLDLLETFVSQESPESYYFKIDGHWNKKGHRLASEKIVAYLIKNNLATGQQQVSCQPGCTPN